MIRLNDILDRVQAYQPDADIDVLRRAYVFSAKVHQQQVRLSGEPYLIHPLEVASILTELNMDIPSIVTGLLHDTVEDTLTTLDTIRELFGEEITYLVDGVTKISKISFSTHEERQAENFRKMIIAMAKDIRVLLIKLADRLHNMQTITYHEEKRREEISQETLDIYVPLANRLGIGWLKNELENLAFMTIKPTTYAELSEKLESRRKELTKYSKDVIGIIEKELKKNKINANLQGRIKHLYGIYHKMTEQKIDFDDVYDIIAFRVIVGTVKDCYGALGIIHSLWKPVPGRFKDYIAMPKPNMYQSLHTTVIGPQGERIEIQIRTEDMHRIAEKGIAGHWRYKEGKENLKKGDEKKYEWMQRLVEWQHDLKDPSEFLKTVKIDLFPEEVYIFTPKGDVKAFPKGATPVDFAYSVHTDVGNRCVGAKINGKLESLRYKLKNGDTVEILTKPKQTPSKDWLRYVVTSRAKQKIKHWLIDEQRERSISLGREILEKEFRKNGLNFQKMTNSLQMKEAVEVLKAKDFEDLLSKIANAHFTPTQIIEFFIPGQTVKPEETIPEEIVKKKEKKGGHDKSGVLVRGEHDLMINYAKCCNPVPGDKIIGFISRGRGVIVHTTECQNVLDLPPERFLDVSWDISKRGLFHSKIIILCANRKGLLAKITQAISNEDANISGATIASNGDTARCDFHLEVIDLDHLKRVMKAIENQKDVIKVERIS